MYLYGKNSVLERLRHKPMSIRRIYLQENFHVPAVLELVKSRGIPVRRVTEGQLMRIKHADRLQGIVAEVEKFRYTQYDRLCRQAASRILSLICLDNINDPHNLGSIIRTAACLGNFGIVIPRYSSCEVNDTVMHVASGGENFVPVAMVNNLASALGDAKEAGCWIVGAVVEDGQDLNTVSLPFPLCLVLGSEGKGIRHGVKKQLDMKVRLPMNGARLSFNVAMASAIFCYEISKQKEAGRRKKR